ncbi:NAD(P)H-hydrate dehydratase [Chitinophaga sedimenti]|uniref:NAD(P)H-hydrate dehydratase n=1 Tax=Chitinophaga sedimenti TaxID=2033606 RepID=UPI002006C8AE|nr:NAD(P)H-hydrate dehydratase [Chitinophaga sedimenti]MCK7553917.1 NAD(P)H-hydrate dehydratase [Chitinophaga sedimenti]
MKIFSAAQIRAADAYTIEHEPVSSLMLMERAAAACASWLRARFMPATPLCIFCGKGNNGGDGLVIARLLLLRGYTVDVYIVHHNDKPSADHAANYAILEKEHPDVIHHIHAQQDFPELPTGAILIDAIFGTGLSRPVEGWVAGILHRISDNKDRHTIVAIDMPSGLMADASSGHAPGVHAHYTLSFECYKLAFLMPENADRCGEVHILPIGLHPAYIANTITENHIIDKDIIHTIYQPRKAFSHKGTYGHALLVAGSYGKMGAAVLAARACLRTGVGLLTVHVPRCGYNIIQTTVPSAMCIAEVEEQHSIHFHEGLNPNYKCMGIGPGIGTETATARSLERLLDAAKTPMVLDADALNILGTYPALLQKVPKHSLLTPHPKEFERLFGPTANDFERLSLLSQKARSLQLYILLKGRYTAIACPDGAIYFNTTGNPGMATGGSGDVLTGILTSLLAQDYSPKAAMLFGVWLHGAAGDYAAARLSQEALSPEDIIGSLGGVFLTLSPDKRI